MTHCEACGSPRYGNLAEAVSRIASDALSNPAKVYDFVRGILQRATVEKLVAVYLDAQNKPIGRPVVVSQGSLNTTATAPRELFEPAIKRHAISVVIAHNHPSGNPVPSNDDIRFTETMARAAALLGFTLFDHLVVTRAGFVSLREHGMM